ncbi:hypothetical protein BS47DRAFT_1392850 [Hydnum rufescens UP504]|uniref:Aminoacyl-transfer RNA synthetases class-II family profile domain-containing protein n=1 Tax=Hydnum rufescens UP504 TaxID=1448309 RepID=A0A9P6DXJ5_9AGAM|nr:hypothetical protein BS47DRAFT_1392850 [Hydnum rufescens UP504]
MCFFKLQANIIAESCRHFIAEEHMLKVDTMIMTPAPVFKTSGHVTQFADWMVEDVKTGKVLLADHLIERIDNYTGIELGIRIRKYAILNPDTGNKKCHLRPETAQGHFLNFARLLDFSNGRLPFASVQVGRSFRNEISPRAGLIRVREFTMAEIKHFVGPEDKSHVHFSEVKDVKLCLLPKDVQSSGKTNVIEMTVGESVTKGLVDNETLGYFLRRVPLFLIKIGIDPRRLRFRQHMASEMAHGALCNHPAYDLTVHAKKTGATLVARVALPEPVFMEKEVPTFDKKALGKTFQKDSELVRAFVTDLPEEALVKIKNELVSASSSTIMIHGRDLTLVPEILTIERRTLKQSSRLSAIPDCYHVLIEAPEHSYWAREQDIQRGVLSLPAVCSKSVTAKFCRAGVFARVDDSSASIGKRYSRNDELGTPYGVTIDFASAFTLPNHFGWCSADVILRQADLGALRFREHDTTDQRIGKIDEAVTVTTDLVFSGQKRANVYPHMTACRRLIRLKLFVTQYIAS